MSVHCCSLNAGGLQGSIGHSTYILATLSAMPPRAWPALSNDVHALVCACIPQEHRPLLRVLLIYHA